MSAKEEEARRKAAEELQAQKDRAAAAAEALTPQPNTPAPIQFVNIKDDSKQAKDDWAEVVKAYKAKFKKDPGVKGGEAHHDLADNASEDLKPLSFSSEEEAKAFFTEQAEKGFVFGCHRVDQSGKATGDYKLSLGDKKLIEGKVDPSDIPRLADTYRNWLEAENGPRKDALADELRNFEKTVKSERQVTLNPAAEKRAQLTTIKHSAAAGTDDADVNAPTAPKPGNTRPAPY